eukprot:11289137-Alexandrium_andersonii.AAC.1
MSSNAKRCRATSINFNKFQKAFHATSTHITQLHKTSSKCNQFRSTASNLGPSKPKKVRPSVHR